MKETSKSVTEIKRHAAAVIRQLQRDRVPVVITEHGRSAAVLLDVETYEEMKRRMAILEAVARGERAFAAGRVVSHGSAEERLSRWLRPSDG